MRKVNNDDAMKIIDRSRKEPHDDIMIILWEQNVVIMPENLIYVF